MTANVIQVCRSLRLGRVVYPSDVRYDQESSFHTVAAVRGPEFESSQSPFLLCDAQQLIQFLSVVINVIFLDDNCGNENRFARRND